ncbi:MAG: hypothetical protein E7577_02515 [Ruminococcaceae bacterium]|nr:hypothetical protein [Oscillospiraceae bacterium]
MVALNIYFLSIAIVGLATSVIGLITLIKDDFFYDVGRIMSIVIITMMGMVALVSLGAICFYTSLLIFGELKILWH